MANVIDIDKRAGSFEPVVVKFRGEEHALGASVSEFLAVHGVYSSNPQEEDEGEIAYAGRLIRPMLRALSPGIAAVLDEQDLNAAEELAFLPVLQEVAKMIGNLQFREDAG